ncbi:hypothetical protein B0H16DRAFT_1426235 [Mycena metata]|uniref:DUF1254 domain-containing protein n=1 Tax=Mycena metata TaxID=1033252 RepID=A0AAD7I5R7_9AGAR|nr:hypothetical protein B0H16DRAFT_1426235 [Mycena metata]
MLSKIIAFALATVGFIPSEFQDVLNVKSGPQDATVFSLVYGLPLVQYVIFGNSIADKAGEWKTNSFLHETTLANASYHTIVLPNVDTLYSEALIDLSSNNVIATVPPMTPGRFYVLPFYDTYGNNFCNIGTVNTSIAGRYLVQHRPARPGCVMSPAGGQYAGTIYMPTAYGAALLRIEVMNATDVDYIVGSIQPGFTLTSERSIPRAPPLTKQILNDGLSTNFPEYVMQLTARLSLFNPPEVANDVPPVTASLRLAGASRGSYTTPYGVDLDGAYASAQAEISKVKNTSFISYGNGWAAIRPDLAGDFKSHYSVRAFVAANGYMELTATEALYPIYEVNQTHYGNESYVVAFHGKPPVDGFWSLTIYDAAGYLVPNPLNRYSLNDRDNITYPDGTSLLTTPADSEKMFYLLLQSVDSPPSQKRMSNWLPTPGDGGTFNFLLRFYGPKNAIINGEYKFPEVKRA